MNKKRRALLAALDPVVDVALSRRDETDTRLTPPGFAVRMEGGARELMIYGRIGSGGWFDEGIGASAVAAALRELGPGPIDVRINSGGGDVFDGVAIHSLLARHSGTVTTHVDGLAASAASFIAMAGDNVRMARNAFMMIHDGMTMTYGNGATHRTSADLLDKISDTIADIYAEKAGEDVEHWRALMTVNGEDGTWYSGQEALDAGLVDEITGGEDEKEACATARLLFGFNRLPDAAAAFVTATLAEQAAERVEQVEQTEQERAEVEQTSEQAVPEQDDSEREWAWLATSLAATTS